MSKFEIYIYIYPYSDRDGQYILFYLYVSYLFGEKPVAQAASELLDS